MWYKQSHSLFITPKIGCSFRISFKWNDAKNIFEINTKKVSWVHNHPLTYQGVNKTTYNEFKTFITQEHFKKTHTPAQTRDKIAAYFSGKEQKNEFTLPYQLCSYIHYYTKANMFGPSELDAKNLQSLFELVKEKLPNSLCKISEKLRFVEDQPINQLENFVFSSENMRYLYMLFHDMVLIDSTYRTNKFNMPLLIIAGINEENKTFLIGFAALTSEKEENVRWALEKLFNFLLTKPKLICSDSCPTLKKVINDLLPETTHLLCGWHVEQNIAKHLKTISNEFFFSIFEMK